MPGVSATRYRVLFLLLGMALALVVVFAVVLAPGGNGFELPPAIESVSPGNGETVLRQIDLTIDMQVGYTIDVFVDGVHIPSDEIRFSEATGRHTWVPGPTKTFPEWASGLHSVQVSYIRLGGRADAGDVRWTFRVQ